MFGPADKSQVEDGYEAATADISEDIWEAFEAEFDIKRGMWSRCAKFLTLCLS